MSNPILELKNVSVQFSPHEEDLILKDVSIKVYEGETIVIVGMSGSGKTVLLKTLAGLCEPSVGKAYCFGYELSELSIAGRHDLAQKIGMQFQKNALFEDLTCAENVAYPLKEHTQMTEQQVSARVDECLISVGLEKAKNLYPHELSGGMKLRLAIARAIALKPEILYLDDPTAGLDPINSDNMAELILNLKKEINSTLIIVTHDLARAYQFAGRIFFIADKNVIETGSATQTKNSKDPRVQQYIHGYLKGPLTIE